MTDKELMQIAQENGFKSAVISTKDIAVDYTFRTYCEDNLCGKYGANYSCPPDSGTPAELHRKILSKNSALVLQKIYDINGYDDKEAVQAAKQSVNYSVISVMEKMKAEGYDVIHLGYGGCPLCNPCKCTLGEPCAFPDKKISCISAYCINVTKLAKTANMEFDWSTNKLYLFGMILFDKQ